MKSILLVKTSSLGDLVHNLPVVGDLRRAFPDAQIDWVAEEAFAPVPRLHSDVRKVIPVKIRRWRGRPWQPAVWSEVRALLRELRANRYDAVIDTQGLLKSALIARAARGPRYGLDWRSSREPLAMFYDRTFHVPWTLHAVERNRALAAQALGYPLPTSVNYGLQVPRMDFEWLPKAAYAVLLHATSARRKLWPEPNWIELGTRLTHQGMRVILPWGKGSERSRSERIAAGVKGALVPPSLSLGEIASLLAGARAVAGVDTGLTHLAAALGAPTVGIYCATDPAATGIYGCNRAANLGGMSGAPAASDVIAALERLTR